MSEPEYICPGSDMTFIEAEIYICPCGKKMCPACGDEVQTIEEYNENTRINSEER